MASNKGTQASAQIAKPIPCPFCEFTCVGAWPKRSPAYHIVGWAVSCANTVCQAEGPWATTEAGAIAKWNARVAADTNTLMADQPHTISVGRLDQPEPERQPLLVDLDRPEASGLELDASELGY